MFCFNFSGHISVHGGKIILAVDLHAVTGKKERADIVAVQRLLEGLQRLVHLFKSAVRLGGD
jgi:hypothetical protein